VSIVFAPPVRESFLSTPQASLDRRGGLANVIDIVIAPGTGFARLRQAPVWGWAFLVASLLGIAGSLLLAPAILHALEHTLPAQLAANPAIAALPPDQQREKIATVLAVTRTMASVTWVFFPLVLLFSALIQALVMTVVNAATRGDGSFAKFFALSITVGIIGAGFSSLILGVIAAIRGPASFEDAAAVQAVMPGLAVLVPGARGTLAGFLAPLNVFNIWAMVLLALGMIAVGRIPRAAAWATAGAMLFILAAFGAVGAALAR
jgi:hypothetical protein